MTKEQRQAKARLEWRFKIRPKTTDEERQALVEYFQRKLTTR